MKHGFVKGRSYTEDKSSRPVYNGKQICACMKDGDTRQNCVFQTVSDRLYLP